jgi:hypothetical protein
MNQVEGLWVIEILHQDGSVYRKRYATTFDGHLKSHKAARKYARGNKVRVTLYNTEKVKSYEN